MSKGLHLEILSVLKERVKAGVAQWLESEELAQEIGQTAEAVRESLVVLEDRGHVQLERYGDGSLPARITPRGLGYLMDHENSSTSEQRDAHARKSGAGQSTFISYAREDETMALKIYRDLKINGHDPWIDKEDIQPGERWKPAIRRAIKECSIFIALMSNRSVNKRGYVQSEVLHALQALEEFPEDEIFLIPVRLEECQPSHAAIEEINWVDFFPSYERGFERILSALRAKCGDSTKAVAMDKWTSPETRADEAWVKIHKFTDANSFRHFSLDLTISTRKAGPIIIRRMCLHFCQDVDFQDVPIDTGLVPWRETEPVVVQKGKPCNRVILFGDGSDEVRYTLSGYVGIDIDPTVRIEYTTEEGFDKVFDERIGTIRISPKFGGFVGRFDYGPFRLETSN